MTKLKVGIITIVVAAGVTIPLVMQHRAQTKIREADALLRQQTEENNRLAVENQRLARLAARPTPSPASTDSPSPELLRLRGEVGRLRQENASERAAAASKTNGPSALSGVTANPEMRKAIRDQQKAGMSMIYKEFAKRLNLPPEQAERLNDLLADNVMENVDHITTVLRDGKTAEQMEPLFAGQDAALMEKLQALLGPDGFAQYKDYTRNLGSYLVAEQFKGMLTGEMPEKEAKAKQLYQMMQEETQQALANAGLPPDFQTVPMLNFRNIASETEADKSLKLMEGVIERVALRAGSFLSPEDIGKFGEFRKNVINGNRMALTMNRKMMAPGSQ